MKLVRSALVVAAAITVPLVPTAAHADKYVHLDAPGDVVSFTSTSDTAAPDQTNGDITRSTVRHRARKVVLTMRFRDLNGSGYTVYAYAIRTGKMTRHVSLVTIPGHHRGKVLMTTAKGKTVRCRTTRSIDYTANTATVGIPRSCLGRPRWVKVGMGMVTSPTEKFTTGFGDDAGTNGDFNSLAWSPRVHR
jgi:hypothetical protein